MEDTLNTDDLLAERLRHAANESSFSVEEWAQALRELDAWLAEQRHCESLDRKLGYLSCCAEVAARNPLHPSLSLVLCEMLETYGMKAGSDV